jgi:transcriptional regulator with XRE-family HTH domain
MLRPYHEAVASFDHVGAALARLRKRAGINQEDLAARLGLSGSTSVSSIETGNPRANTIGRYLDAIGCTPQDLANALGELTYGATLGAASEVREAPPDPLDEKVSQLKQALDDVVLAIKEKGR